MLSPELLFCGCLVLFFTHSPCIYPFLNFTSFTFHIPQPFPAFSRAERIPVWAQLLYKRQASSLLAEASYWMSAALSQLYASPRPARHVRDLPPAPCAVGLRAGSCCGAADFKQCVSVAASSRLPRADELAGQSKFQR